MLSNAFISEIFKYKRTLVLWLVVIGGFFPALVTLLFILTGDIRPTWETFATTGLDFFDMLALLLVAIIAGNAFVLEYKGGGTNIMHAYPIPRPVQYLTKLFVVLILVLAMHLIFLAFIFVSAWIFAEDALLPGFAVKMLSLTLLTAAGNFMLAPLSAIVGMAVKKTGAYILAGVGLFIVYMSFAGSDYSRYALPCVPSEILKEYILNGKLMSAELGGALLFSAAVFLLLLCAGALCYSRIEI